MKNKIFFGVMAAVMFLTSCVNDLNIKPKDPNSILADNLADDPEYMKQVLGKIYASFIIAGQGANGGADISAPDEAFFTTMRALWNLQEITTDEAICAWGDTGISDLNTQTWTPANPFLTALYQRLSLSVTYANDFLNATAGNEAGDVVRYRAEARFLRALAYYWLMDLFGNPPFTTEADGVGKYYPKQTTRKALYDYVVSELKAIEPDLGAPGSSYPQADKGAAWMLLARVYLNAEVYTGTADWTNAKLYATKVIESGAYELNPNYRHNFSANNEYASNKEMIFAFAADGINTQGPVGTTFIIQSSSDATYIPAAKYHDLPGNPNWNGNRARKELLNLLVDTIKTYGDNPIPTPTSLEDSIFGQSPDTRVYLKMKRTINIPTPSASGDYGVGVYKFTARNADGSTADNYHPEYASTDFPIFRFSDAYLMRAEAQFRLGESGAAVTDINEVRERAFKGTSNNITVSDLDAKFILDERAREFYYEAQRRTDLVRFGQFTSGTYHWQWKGNNFDGIATDEYKKLFPIPGDEISANPNIKQNSGY